MTALSANAQRPVRIPPGGLNTAVVALAGYTNHTAAFTVYKGAVLMSDVSIHDGYFAPKDANTGTGDIPGGIAAEKVVIAATDLTDGLKKVTVYRNGVWGFAKGSLAITDIGALAYASDDNTVTTTDTNNLLIGRIVDVDATYAWVDIENHWMVPIS
jgi:hypothetical protein